MTSIIKIHSINSNLQFEHIEMTQSYISLASILSEQILAALQWEEFFFNTISYLQSSILTLFVRNIHMVMQFLEIIEEKIWLEKVDVKNVNVNNLKIIEQAGKKGGKKKKGGEKESVEKGKSDENNAEKRKEEEEKRQSDWKESWNKAFEAKEASEDKAFCAIHGYYPKPKTQTNLWIQVSQGKAMQDVQFCFKNVPIPKPEPPPLPPLEIEKAVEPSVSEKVEKKGGKKKGKKK